MCLILFAHKIHPDYPLILAGRDLVGGGTWLGITRTGRLATVANFRHPSKLHQTGLSRGMLTVDFLRSDVSPGAYLETVAQQAERYKGFNLLIGDGAELAYYSNRERVINQLSPGIYGLSNALLDTPWPKVTQGKAALAELLAADLLEPEALLGVLADTSRPPDEQLPDTGIGSERERLLSSRFITSTDYGTRASTVILFDRTGQVTFVERSFGPSSSHWQDVRYRFRLQQQAVATAPGPPGSDNG
jgi:uncharacterized protein with NRDE domain